MCLSNSVYILMQATGCSNQGLPKSGGCHGQKATATKLRLLSVAEEARILKRCVRAFMQFKNRFQHHLLSGANPAICSQLYRWCASCGIIGDDAFGHTMYGSGNPDRQAGSRV